MRKGDTLMKTEGSPARVAHAIARNRQRGGIITGLLSVFAILVLLGIAGVFSPASNVRFQPPHRMNGKNVAIDVPGGHINTGAQEHLDPAALGVPIYPGASR